MIWGWREWVEDKKGLKGGHLGLEHRNGYIAEGGSLLTHPVPPSFPGLQTHLQLSGSPSRPSDRGRAFSHPTPTTIIINPGEPQQIKI